MTPAPPRNPRQPTEDGRDPYVDVACWMRELASRGSPSLEASLPPISITRYIDAPRHSAGGIVYQALALTALASAYFQYYFLDVLVQIETLRSIIVFVFTGQA
jgi:hypothetical protein